MNLQQLAQNGRNGDTSVAHLTPGEMVIPKEVAAVRPDLVAHISDQIRKMGGNPQTKFVGNGRINPRTGIEEFATEAEIREAYKSTLGRDIESDGALGYWMNQGDSWKSSFQNAAAAEIAARPAATYTPTTGTQVQQQQQIKDSAESLYGRTADQLSAAGAGYGTGIGLYPNEGAPDPNYAAYKSYNDDMNQRLLEAGRTNAPAGSVYRAKAVYDPSMKGALKIVSNDGTELTNFGVGAWDRLDSLGVDPESYKSAAQALAASGYVGGANFINDANNYKPMYASAADSSLLKSGIDPTKNAQPFFATDTTPSIREFMDKTGMSFQSASQLLSSNGLGSTAKALVDWDKVMASPDPARSLNAAYAAIASDPNMSKWATQSLTNNYSGWALGAPEAGGGGSPVGGYGGGYGVVSGAGAGVGGYGGGFAGGASGAGFSQFGAPLTGLNLAQLQTATPWSVNPDQTVQSQLQQIIAADSPLMQQARTRALQASNARGLLNSSVATSAGEAALYDAAMPIATTDAGTYAENARYNADTANTFSRDSNAFTRDAFMADFNLSANEWAKQRDQQRELQSLSVQQQYALDRDAVQNGYQSARDALQNGYQIARDAATQQYTLQRDATVNKFNAEQTNIDRERQDAGFQREIVAQATSDMQTLKTKFAEIVNVTTRDLNVSPENRSKAISEASAIYKPLIEAAAKRAGLDPTQATLGMTFTAEPAVAT